MVSFCQQVFTSPLPSHCLPPPSDVGLEFEMFTLNALLRGCLHDVHVRYFFNPLLSQGMEIKTLCSKRFVVFWMLVSVGHLRERFHTPRTLCTTFYVVAYGAQAVLTLGAEVSELD